MHDAPPFPDDSDFGPAAVVGAIQPFGVPEVGEDRFDGAHPVAVSLPAFGGIHLGPRGGAVGAGGFDTNAQSTTFAVFALAAGSEFTDLTEVVVDFVFVELPLAARRGAAASVAERSFLRRAGVGVVGFMVGEVCGGEAGGVLGAGLAEVLVAALVSLVAVAEVGVGKAPPLTMRNRGGLRMGPRRVVFRTFPSR